MATLFLPRTCPSRRAQTYAQLIRCVLRAGPIPFEGRLFRTGAKIEPAELRPAEDWPATPLLIEYAGNDRTGRGHNRSNDIHLLWKFEGGEWIELARVTSQGPEWQWHMKPIVLRELGAQPRRDVELARDAGGRVLIVLDAELNRLEDEGRVRMMAFLYHQFTARLVA